MRKAISCAILAFSPITRRRTKLPLKDLQRPTSNNHSTWPSRLCQQNSNLATKVANTLKSTRGGSQTHVSYYSDKRERDSAKSGKVGGCLATQQKPLKVD